MVIGSGRVSRSGQCQITGHSDSASTNFPISVIRSDTVTEVIADRSLSSLPLRQTHLKIDWIIIGHHKNLDTIGKQNYQELVRFLMSIILRSSEFFGELLNYTF